MDRATLLASGTWIDDAQARFHSIRYDELYAAWTSGRPLDRAQDWRVDHTDRMEAQLAYRRFALACHANGWSPLPEQRFGDRLPLATFDARGRYQIKPSERRDRRQPSHDLVVEAGNAGTYDANLAMVIGPASGDIRVLDCDILDEDLAAQVYDIAMEELGVTPFQRVGRAPKIVLIYRMAGDDLAIPTHSYVFLNDRGAIETDGEGDDVVAKNAIEFLGAGRNFTCYGLHHKTAQSFDWSRGGMHPAMAGPEHAPLVTKKQLNAFFTRVNRVRELTNFAGRGSSSPTGGDSEFGKFEVRDEVWTPVPANSKGSWIVDAEGYVRRGREAYMAAMAWAMMSANMDMLRTPQGSAMLLTHYKAAVVNTIVSEGKWSHARAEKACEAKFASTRPKFDRSLEAFDNTGKYLLPAIPWRIMEDGSRPFSQHAPTTPRPDDGSMDWLPEQPSVFSQLSNTQKIKGLIKVAKSAEQIAADKSARALVAELADRQVIHARVSEQVRNSALSFIGLIDHERSASALAPLSILMAPTGAGKTTTVIDAVAEYLRDHPRQPGEGPILFMMPSHANIEEALQVAARSGMIVPNSSEVDGQDMVDALNAVGVKAALLSGKRNHCLRLDDLNKLSGAGIGTAGLCGATIEEDGDSYAASKKRKAKQQVETEEVLCPFRERGECGYWKQMLDIEQADIVFLAHSYLTMHQPPAAIKKARAVFVDESIVYRLLHFTELRLDTLEKTRSAPWLTKKEQAEQPNRSAKDLGEDLMQQREHIARVVVEAFGDKRCPAQAVIDAKCTNMIRSAIKTVTRSHSAERDVNPRMTASDIDRFVARPAGLMLIEEEKFWRVLEDRVERIRAGTAAGETDARFHLFFKTESIIVAKKAKQIQVPYLRVSWRSEMNWPAAPMMLLDASASPEIIAKCSGREVTVHRVDAPLHVRTVAMIERPWATRAFVPPADADRSEIELAHATIRKARALITKTAVSYGHGRVLVGATIAVREVLSQNGWLPPKNVDWVHYGNLRGRDGYKHHVAAISIGRSEQPIGVIDGLAAALTFDDAVPEKPYDILGTGLTKDGSLLFRKGEPRVIPLRSGHDVGHLVMQMPGRWARILELQWRDEELRQFLGRLRPVYRGGAPVEGVSDEVPVYICMSSALPEGIVVDELLTLDDMIAGGEFHELVRLAGGVLSPGLTPRMPSAKVMLQGMELTAWTETVLPAAYSLRSRILSAMHTIKAKVDGKPQTIRVAAWHPDPEAALQHALAVVNAGTFAKSTIEIISIDRSAYAPVTASKAAKPDRVDQEFAAQAPFGDTEMLLEDREDRLRAAQARMSAAGRDMDIEAIEHRVRSGHDLDDLVHREVAEFERSRWVRMYDGEELFEVEPHYLQAA